MRGFKSGSTKLLMLIWKKNILLIVLFLGVSSSLYSQTLIKGFIEANTSYANDKMSFGFGEQDLFITSEINDRISFLGETIFKYDPSASTKFGVSIERVVIKYNIKGNHNFLIGKHHTPINYWNDTYHHGRVFFPTVERPSLFTENIIPLHTTGISLQGHDLGKIRFGYDLMVGNGLGSGEIKDNDKYKSLTLAVHVKPYKKLRIGASFYRDIISKGAEVHGKIQQWEVKQNIFTGSIANFGKKIEFLAEGSLTNNHTDTTGSKTTLSSYAYAGYKITEKIIPYVRVDNIDYQEGEIFYTRNNTTSFLGGIRYQFNYLAVVKLEYAYTHSKLFRSANKVTFQFAIGF